MSHAERLCPATAPAKLQASVRALLEYFQRADEHGQGVVDEAVLVGVFEDIGFSSVRKVLQAAGCREGNKVKYEQLLSWLFGDTEKPPLPPSRSSREKPSVENSRAQTLESIANGLLELASSETDAEASSALIGYAASLRRVCFSLVDSPSRPSTREAADVRRRSKEGRSIKYDARVEAAEVLERTEGCTGQAVSDIEEVAIAMVQHRRAIASWRGCHGLRLYRSATVTEALRLICSARVPGLGEASYLDVFKSLTKDSSWEHHIYLFGGLVRDIIRRKVGNDIDIAFTAPAAELEETCKRLGYKCALDGDYILIGDAEGEEYLEGMVITHNGILPSYHADFSMNWIFYDFVNDIIVDKTGHAVQAILDNRCEIPCPRHEWDFWVDVNGSRVLFRYYKFLIRGYEYYDDQMAYVAGRLLAFWTSNTEETIDIGRIALGNLVSCQDTTAIDRLRCLVLRSFDLGASTGSAGMAPQSRLNRSLTASATHLLEQEEITWERSYSVGRGPSLRSHSGFLSGQSWWQKGWLPLLKLEA